MRSIHYYIDAFRNYANFSGRANRTRFWMFALFYFIACAVLAFVGFVLPVFAFLLSLYKLAALLPVFAAGMKLPENKSISCRQ